MTPPDVELVLGGARSGKSGHALAVAQAWGRAHGESVSWIATAEAHDDEMRERIERHRAERSPAWRSVEAPLHLAAGLLQEAVPGRCVVVDCLTLWLSNCLLMDDAQGGEAVWPRERDALLAALGHVGGRLLLVSNEVGCGIVPDNALARRFRDEAGRLHQQIAERVPRVTLVVAGIALAVKRPDHPREGAIDAN